MGTNRHATTALLFLLGSLGVALLSLSGGGWGGPRPTDGAPPVAWTNREAHFENAVIHVVRDGAPLLRLDASDLVADMDGREYDFLDPSGFTLADGEEVRYRARAGTWSRDGGFLQLARDVRLETGGPSGPSTLLAGRLRHDVARGRIEASGGVRTRALVPDTGDTVDVSSDSLTAFPRTRTTTYTGGARGSVRRRARYEEGIEFSSGSITVNLPGGTVALDHGVTIERGPVTASAERGEIFLENADKRLRYFVLNDNVRVVERVSPEEPGRAPFERRAFSERLEGFASEQRMVLEGSPRVIQGDDVVRGSKVTLREDVDTIEVEDANTNFRLR